MMNLYKLYYQIDKLFSEIRSFSGLMTYYRLIEFSSHPVGTWNFKWWDLDDSKLANFWTFYKDFHNLELAEDHKWQFR